MPANLLRSGQLRAWQPPFLPEQTWRKLPKVRANRLFSTKKSIWTNGQNSTRPRSSCVNMLKKRRQWTRTRRVHQKTRSEQILKTEVDYCRCCLNRSGHTHETGPDDRPCRRLFRKSGGFRCAPARPIPCNLDRFLSIACIKPSIFGHGWKKTATVSGKIGALGRNLRE